jgi:hypothetical protein
MNTFFFLMNFLSVKNTFKFLKHNLTQAISPKYDCMQKLHVPFFFFFFLDKLQKLHVFKIIIKKNFNFEYKSSLSLFFFFSKKIYFDILFKLCTTIAFHGIEFVHYYICGEIFNNFFRKLHLEV